MAKCKYCTDNGTENGCPGCGKVSLSEEVVQYQPHEKGNQGQNRGKVKAYCKKHDQEYFGSCWICDEAKKFAGGKPSQATKDMIIMTCKCGQAYEAVKGQKPFRCTECNRTVS